MSGHHLLFLLPSGESSWQLARADDVKVGDALLALDPQDATQPPQLSKVTRLSKLTAQGAFTPLTTSGRLFVEGVAVSSMAVSGEQLVGLFEGCRAENRLFWAEAFYSVLIAPACVLHYFRLPIEWMLRGKPYVFGLHRSAMGFLGAFW
mmetsp:Transcript_8261/g.19405  ORF Transcript_8261/g.19405 Transcript_8261/m.19405 type:complete len:149 (+) Transcript_8261:204-650(+)